MGGAFNVFGQFLDGYMKGRNQKQQMKQQQDAALIDEAMSWAKVADTTKNDSIREMATRNMQDRMVKHEKSQGEKNGIGAIIKLFRHDKKDSPSFINSLAKQVGKPAELMSAPGATSEDLYKEDPQAAALQQYETEQAVNPTPQQDPNQLQYNPEESVDIPDRLDNISLPKDQTLPAPPPPIDSSKSLLDKGWKMEKPTDQAYAGAADRAQGVMSQIAPGTTTFLPRYGGGTRFSQTNEEMNDVELKMKEKENKIAQDAAFDNQKRLYTWQREQKELEDKKSLDQLKSTQLYVNATPEMREQMEYQTVTKNPLPTLPADWGKPTSDFEYEGDKVVATNAYGKKINATLQWREKNPYAAMDYDSKPAGERNFADSMKIAGDVGKAVQDVEKRLKESQISENNSRGSYYRAMPQIERDKLKETIKKIKGSNQAQARIRISELDKVGWPGEMSRLVPDSSPGMPPTNEQLQLAILGKGPDGKPVQDPETGAWSKPLRNPETGRAFGSIEEYKDFWYKEKLGGADPNSVRYFSVTGVDPWQNLDMSEEDESGPTPTAKPGATTPDNNTPMNTKVDISNLNNARAALGLGSKK